jgi:hypothetical protein
MREVVILKRAQHWPEREHLQERSVLELTFLNGRDLRVAASPDVYELAADLDPVQPVIVTLAIDFIRYGGRSTDLIATGLETLDGAKAGDIEDPKEIRQRQAALRAELASREALGRTAPIPTE